MIRAIRPLLFVALFSAHLCALNAQTAKVAVETTTPAVGQPFALQIQIEGSRVRPPAVLEIDGLDLARTGQSTSLQIENGQVTRTALYNYQAVATKEGTLTIPSLEIGDGPEKLTTQPLTLTVKKGTAQPQPRLGPGIPSPPGGSPPRTPNQPDALPKIDDSTVFLKVVPEREQIYVGEAVELKIKAYIDARIPLADFERQVTLQGEDFVFQTPVGPDVRQESQRGRRVYVCKQERIDGQTFNVLTFRSSLTAVKPGTFTIAPLTYNTTIIVPRQQRPRRRSTNPFDSFFGGDPFDDPFFDNIRNKQRLQLTSKELQIEVLPLPSEGRPEHFNGAIGRFSMQAKPDKPALKIDEALTMTTTITGHGNFERINDLAIEGHEAWRAYPPKILFKGDDLGLSGEKTFENTFIANDQTDSAPKVRFAYFDPETKEYISLESQDYLVMVSGTKASLKNPLSENPSSESNGNDSLPSVLAVTHAVHFLKGNGSPILASTGFLTANGLGLAGLITLLLWKRGQTPKTPSPKQQRRQAKRDLETTLGQLSAESDPRSFANKSLRCLSLIHALEKTPESSLMPSTDRRESLLASDFVSELSTDSPHQAELESLLRWSDTLNWGNGSADDDDTFSNQRHSWIEAMRAVATQRS